MKLDEKPFNAKDAYSLLKISTENIKSNIELDTLVTLSELGEARTWTSKDGIVGCGGILIYQEGKCEAWSVLNNKLAVKYKRPILVLAKRFLNDMAKKHRIVYMKASWRKDFDPKIKWLEHLGFKKEPGTITLKTGESYIYSRRFQWD